MNVKNFIVEIIGTIVGTIVMAISISLLLLPNELSSGGFSGIATIFYYKLNFPMGITIMALNAPLFLLSGVKIGKAFFIKSLIGTTSLSFFTDLFEKYGAITNDRILACIYGGIFIGIGTAVILRANSSTGGSDLLSAIIKRYNPKIETGKMIIFIDFVIILLNVIFLGNIEIGLYSGITIYIMGLMIDVIFEGVFFTKLLFIISDKNEEISKAITEKINRGITGLYGKGMYTGDEKLVMMCAVDRREIANVKDLILEIDKDAFVIVSNAREALGYGFKTRI